MDPNFPSYNAVEALEFLWTVKDAAARGALGIFHAACLEASGVVPLSWLRERLVTEKPVDLLLLYEAVATTFERWDGVSMAEQVEPDTTKSNIMYSEEIRLCAKTVKSGLLRSALGRFMRAICSKQLSTNVCMDLNFACRLFVECFRNEEIIKNIVCGNTARDHDRLAHDRGPWTELWTGGEGGHSG
jgi:hypothetical protein